MSRVSGSKNIPATQFASVVKSVSDADGNLQDVADELGLKVTSVATRLSQLRKKFPDIGVPSFKRGGGGGGAKLDGAVLAGIFSGNAPVPNEPSTTS